MKKIIYLTSIPSPFQEEFIEAIEKIVKEKTEVTVLYGRPMNPERAHWGKAKFGKTIEAPRLRNFLNFLKQAKPDVVVFSQFTGLLFMFGVLWCNFNKVKFFIGPSELMPIHKASVLRNWLQNIFLKFFLKKSAAVMVMGNEGARHIQKYYRGPVEIIPYSFDLTNILSYELPPLESNPITFLYSGRLVEFRNPLLCIKMFARLVNDYPVAPLKLIMSGKGQLDEKCRGLISSLGIDGRVEWITEFKDWYDIHTIYKKAHVLLSLQHYSTWGLITQEAMAAGMGIISTITIYSADQLLIDGYNGFLVPINEEVIYERMKKYVENPDLIRIHGARSKEIVKTIDVSKTSEKFVQVLEKF